MSIYPHGKALLRRKLTTECKTKGKWKPRVHQITEGLMSTQARGFEVLLLSVRVEAGAGARAEATAVNVSAL